MFVVWLLFTFLASSEANLVIDASTENITTYAVPLKVSCKFTFDDEPDVANLVSLSLLWRKDSQSTNFEPLISGNSLNSDIDEGPGFEGKSTGSITNNRGNGLDSFLAAEFDNPNGDHAGEYMCQSQCVDGSGNFVSNNKTAPIYSSLPDSDTIRKQIKKLESTLDKAKAKESKQCGPYSHKWFNLIDEIVGKKAVKSREVLFSTQIFNDTSFYLFITPTVSFDNANTICLNFDGYLAEINSRYELIFIKEALEEMSRKKLLNFESLLTGAFFPDPDADFEFSLHKNDPMYLGDWAPLEPFKLLKSSNWLVLSGWKHGVLNMATGNKNDGRKKQAYLCEISFPHKIYYSYVPENPDDEDSEIYTVLVD